MKYLWTILMAVILSAICNTLVAQEKSVEVSVDMEMVNGEEQRNILITIGEGNKSKEIKWSDNGTIPAEVKAQLEKEGIDINMLEGDGEVEVTVESDGNKKIEKEIEIIKIESSEHEGHHMSDQEIEVGDDGKAVIIKINKGEEIPADVRELLEEHDIDIDALLDDALEEGKASQTKVIRKKAIRINSKDDDGNEKVIEWDGNEGEMPEDIRKLLEEEGIELDGDHEMIFIGDDGEVQEIDIKKSSKKQQYILKSIDENGEERIIEWNGVGEMPEEFKKAEEGSKKEIRVIKKKSKKSNQGQLGVMVEDTDSGLGVRVIDVIQNSPAAAIGIKEGDIIPQINRKAVNSIDELLSALEPFQPGDDVLIDVQSNDTYFVKTATLADDLYEQPNIFIFQNAVGEKEFDILQDVEKCEPGEVEKKIEINIDENVAITEKSKLDRENITAEKQLSLEDFKAFPNPTSGTINISFNADAIPTIVQVTDITGKEIFRENIKNFNGRYSKDLDLSSYAKGQFVVFVLQDEKMFTQSIILQ